MGRMALLEVKKQDLYLARDNNIIFNNRIMIKLNFDMPISGGLIPNKTPLDVVRRYEKVLTTILSNESDGVQYVVNQLIKQIENYFQDREQSGKDIEPFVLGLSTGRTPIELYREMIKRYNRGELSFKRVKIVLINEFYPIMPSDKHSHCKKIHEQLLNHIDILPDNVLYPDGTIETGLISEYCAKYDSYARNMNLLIVGMSEDGQIGFNEPESFVKSKTRLVKLSYSSRKIQSTILPNNITVPQYAITVGLDTIISSENIILMAWGSGKSDAVKCVVEGDITSQVPASYLQNHPFIEVVIDKAAGEGLVRESIPWLVGECDWTPKFIRKAVIWLCGVVGKPILKLSYNDYIENSLGSLLEATGKSYDTINIEVFNDLQHTITGWPGGKPNATDNTRPVASEPYPKRVIIFSPHPDDDVISMGGTFIRLVEQGHDVHVAYQTSGNVAVHDDVVLQSFETSLEMGFEDRYSEIKAVIASRRDGEPQPVELLKYKGAIRRAEAKAACRSFGLNADTNCHFLNQPFYETGGVKKGSLSQADIDIIVEILRELKPHQIYTACDLADPHGTHKVCLVSLIEALKQVSDDEWMQNCNVWLYRGAWMEWDLASVDMAVPLSPQEMIQKRHAIYRHQSQKDIIPFPGNDSREFWQRAEDRTQNTAKLYDELGMAEYQAIEVFVKMF